MADVTSKSATWPIATAPSVASAGPSIAGCVFHVIVLSLQPQLVILWMLPPVTLFALVAFATCSCRCADDTARAPTPLTLTRRSVRCTPVVPGFVAVPLSTARSVFVPKLVAGRSDWTYVSAVTAATGAVVGQTGGGPPTQTLPAQVSAVVQVLPSLHAAVVGVPPPHTPAPSHVVAARHGVVLGQAWPAGSN